MKKRSVVTVVAVVVISVLVIIGAWVMLKDSGEEQAQGQDASISQQGPQVPESAPVPARPDCPSTGVGGLDLECLGGKNGTKPQDKGVNIVNIWAWWCEPCRSELPHLQEYAKAHPEYDVSLVHVDELAGNGAALLNELNIDLPSYQDPERSLRASLGLPPVVPVTAIFVDGELANVVAQSFNSTDEITAAVDKSLAGAGH